jgi:hypothetical protein
LINEEDTMQQHPLNMVDIHGNGVWQLDAMYLLE